MVAFQDLGVSSVTFIDTEFAGKCFIKESHMAGKTAHFVECLPCHHEDLSLILKTHTKSKQTNKLGMEVHAGCW